MHAHRQPAHLAADAKVLQVPLQRTAGGVGQRTAHAPKIEKNKFFFKEFTALSSYAAFRPSCASTAGFFASGTRG
jgi:hypothetical protein